MVRDLAQCPSILLYVQVLLSPCLLLGYGGGHIFSQKSLLRKLFTCWNCHFLFPSLPLIHISRLVVSNPSPDFSLFLRGFWIAREISSFFPLLFPQPLYFSRQTRLISINAGKPYTIFFPIFLVDINPRLWPLSPLKIMLLSPSARILFTIVLE